jgi:hypothetical protein
MPWWTAFLHLPLSSFLGLCESSLLWHDLLHPAVGSHWSHIQTEGKNAEDAITLHLNNIQSANFSTTNTEAVLHMIKWQSKLQHKNLKTKFLYVIKCWNKNRVVRFVAFLVTEYGEVFSGYQLDKMVEWWENRFKDHLCHHLQGASLVLVLFYSYLWYRW